MISLLLPLIAVADDALAVAIMYGLMTLLSKGADMFSQFKANKESERVSKELQEDAQAHEELMQQRQMDYNSYPSQVAMMKEAGLNPGLMYGSGAGSLSASSTGSGALGPMPNIQSLYKHDERSIEAPLNAALSLMQTKANVKQSEAQTQNFLAQVPYIQQQMRESMSRQGLYHMQKQGESLNNFLKLNDLQYRDLNNQLDIMAKRYGLDKVSAETHKLVTSADLDEMQRKYTQTQINMASFEYNKNKRIWDECADYVIKGVKAENDNKRNEAMQSFYEAKKLAKQYGIFERTDIDPEGGPFGANSIIAPLLDEVMSNAKRRMNLGNEYITKAWNWMKDQFK